MNKFFSLIAGFALLLSGCTYEEVTDNTTIDEVAPDAATADSGGDSEMGKLNPGTAKSLVLTRGVSTAPSACGNAADKSGDVFTVQFAIFPAAPLPQNTAPTIAYAIVKWSVGGQDIQRIINISNGASLTGVGEGATIQVYDATQNGNNQLATDGLQYTVTATVAPGSRGSNINPPTFFPSLFDQQTGVSGVGLLAPGANTTIPIPPGAGATSVQVLSYGRGGGLTRLTDLGIQVQQQNELGIVKIYNSLDYADGWVPLDPSATSINLENLNVGGGENNDYSAVFGVDG
jgi:hypothetical protein